MEGESNQPSNEGWSNTTDVLHTACQKGSFGDRSRVLFTKEGIDKEFQGATPLAIAKTKWFIGLAWSLFFFPYSD